MNHLCQCLHQMKLKTLNETFNESATKNGEIFSIIIYAPVSQLRIVMTGIVPVSVKLSLWAQNYGYIPSFAIGGDRKLILSNLPFWKAEITHVAINDTLMPLQF